MLFNASSRQRGCPSRVQVHQINTDNEINNAYCLRRPQLGDLTDVCKDGNLLKVNSCNCAAELDEAKEGVSTASIIIRREKSLKSKNKSGFKRQRATNTLFYGCVSFGPKFTTAVMVNMSDLRWVCLPVWSFGFIYFPLGPRGCKHSLGAYQSHQCGFNLRRVSKDVVVIIMSCGRLAR